MDKSLSATCLLFSNVMKGDPSPKGAKEKYREEDEEKAVKRAMN